VKRYQLLLIDLDGTMYRGSEKIEEAPIFMKYIQETQQDYMFLTNNSSKKPSDVVSHLASFGVDTEESKVYTTSLATAQYITDQKPGASVFVIGEEGLEVALKAAGCRLITGEQNLVECDFVVMGLDRHITYDKLANAALAVRSGATFISTNADKALPTERGLLPGNGSLTSVITTTTREQPLFIGKPEPLMIDLILQKTGLQKKDLLMIGDNYETDILAGIGAGIDTAIVFTGYTSKEELKGVTVKPTYQWNTLLEAINR
jgi:4-nitrophenyl phosphatase